ncbi:mannonate dehydratase [Carboxylicivirga sp. A043]|uniref:mannonate dehydratase n=1 Tax=Carboxylicivirga litoralis TaxID=2816963 RepID=UPI0021CB22AC|nr:mannonate dehydratase [Carboxylicivirga sp. A043]MCU4157165.1 mannonate dehydratase [Carboxylicivirga sp. A043]
MIEQTWRWYGPNDRITLSDIKQTGATGIVTALHHVPNGEVWTIEEIQKRKVEIEAAGLVWSVVESVPVHEDIKKQSGNWEVYVANYQQSIRNLGECGIETICYNFMPVLDWSRTNLESSFDDGSLALIYEQKVFAAFDIHILKRPGAAIDYTDKIVQEAEAYFNSLDEAGIESLTNTVIKGLPGAEESYTLEQFQAVLDGYKDIDDARLRQHLQVFLEAIIPIAEESGVRMAIHPDDPPWGLLGLPRVVSTLDDAKTIISTVDSISNGITLCTGSWGAGYFNDLSEMAKELAPRINFAHLRNVNRDTDYNFNEDYLFNGDVDIYAVLKAIVEEEERRKQQGRNDFSIPVRPDHGNQMLGDVGQDNNPGYSLYGRMKGLAEIRGLELGIRRSLLK